MTIEAIYKVLHEERESLRRVYAILDLSKPDSGKDTAGIIATDSRALSKHNDLIAVAQRSLNRQKKMLSLLRKTINR